MHSQFNLSFICFLKIVIKFIIVICFNNKKYIKYKIQKILRKRELNNVLSLVKLFPTFL